METWLTCKFKPITRALSGHGSSKSYILKINKSTMITYDGRLDNVDQDQRDLMKSKELKKATSNDKREVDNNKTARRARSMSAG
ncbi:hypothetical protein JTB14_017744 [Gonioctena quinquepunctata]|nr:hypothetical protein JTB14_017744 [Gonioctena quinquepunctata]